MADFTTAAESIRRMAVTFQGIIQVADALAEIGSVQQAVDEANKAVEVARKDKAAAESEVAAAKASLAMVQEKAADMLDVAQKQGQAILASAAKVAIEAKDEAEAAAAGTVLAAKAEAGRLMAGRDEYLVAFHEQKDKLMKEIAAMDVEFAGKSAAVSGLEARLAKAQASIAKLLG